MGLLADLDANIKRACSCDWLYFNRELLTVFVSDIYSSEQNSDVASLQLLINGACDCEQVSTGGGELKTFAMTVILTHHTPRSSLARRCSAALRN
jgi:hypothetical protein